MADGTVLDAVLRRDRVVVVACLAAVVVLAWAYLAMLSGAMAAMTEPNGWGAFMALMPMGRWGPWEYTLGFVMWSLMMIGMMLPSAAPMIVIHARVTRRARAQGQPAAPTVAFAAGYLLVWSAFGLAAAMVQGALVDLALVTTAMTSGNAMMAGGVLVAAGLYQWTPQKRACLEHCRAPIAFMARHWRPGARGALLMGLRHGAYCVGCCWALMGVLFAVGVMNLTWVAAIAIFVLVEKAAPFGPWTGRIAGAALAAFGVGTLASG